MQGILWEGIYKLSERVIGRVVAAAKCGLLLVLRGFSGTGPLVVPPHLSGFSLAFARHLSGQKPFFVSTS